MRERVLEFKEKKECEREKEKEDWKFMGYLVGNRKDVTPGYKLKACKACIEIFKEV